MPAPVLGGVLRQVHQRVREIQSTNDEPSCIMISTDSALAFFSFRACAPRRWVVLRTASLCSLFAIVLVERSALGRRSGR